jgi:hypothetical protein
MPGPSRRAKSARRRFSGRRTDRLTKAERDLAVQILAARWSLAHRLPRRPSA